MNKTHKVSNFGNIPVGRLDHGNSITIIVMVIQLP